MAPNFTDIRSLGVKNNVLEFELRHVSIIMIALKDILGNWKLVYLPIDFTVVSSQSILISFEKSACSYWSRFKCSIGRSEDSTDRVDFWNR